MSHITIYLESPGSKKKLPQLCFDYEFYQFEEWDPDEEIERMEKFCAEYRKLKASGKEVTLSFNN